MQLPRKTRLSDLQAVEIPEDLFDEWIPDMGDLPEGWIPELDQIEGEDSRSWDEKMREERAERAFILAKQFEGMTAKQIAEEEIELDFEVLPEPQFLPTNNEVVSHLYVKIMEGKQELSE